MNQSRHLLLISVLVAAVGLAVLGTERVFAAIIVDPHPPLRWEQMLDCELVLLGKYRSHEGNVLVLETVRVLKGTKLPPGTDVPINLEHWYSIETGPTGWERRSKDSKPDGIPRLCYKVQLMNPGPAITDKVVPDVRETNLYFLTPLILSHAPGDSAGKVEYLGMNATDDILVHRFVSHHRLLRLKPRFTSQISPR